LIYEKILRTDYEDKLTILPWPSQSFGNPSFYGTTNILYLL